MIIQQLSVFLENKSGRLTEVTDTLGELGINISALSIADTADYGILRMIVAQPEEAMEALRTRGFSVRLTEVVCAVIEDTPGSLARVLRLLSGHGVSIEYMYAFAFGDNAYAVIRTESVEQTIRVLQDNQLGLRTSEEICG